MSSDAPKHLKCGANLRSSFPRGTSAGMPAIKHAALQGMGVEPTPEYLRYYRLLSNAVIYNGPYEALQHKDAASAVHTGSSHRTLGSEYELPLHDDAEAFLESAKALPHPAQCERDDLPADLCAAVAFVVSKGPGTASWRDERASLLAEAAEALLPLNAEIIERMPSHVRYICSGYNLAFMALIIDATKHPDVTLPRRFMLGFPQVGEMEYCPAYAKGGRPPEKPPSSVTDPAGNVAWNRHLWRSVAERAKQEEARNPEAATAAHAAVWETTIKEISAGVCVGTRIPCECGDGECSCHHGWRGMTLEELYSHPWITGDHGGGEHTVRAKRRFGRAQKNGIRAIDDGSENDENAAFGSTSKLSLISSDVPARVCRQYQRERRRRGEGLMAFEYGLEDVRKAFRRCPVAWPGFSVVFVWDPVRRITAAFILPGFAFGVFSAVLAWNRYPALLCHVMRRLLATATVAYYDDFGVGGAAFERGSGQRALITLGDALGLGWAEDKHVAMVQRGSDLHPLGVLHDFSSVPNSGVVLIGVTEERKTKVAALIDEHIAAGRVTRSDCSTVFGKSRFVFSPVFGRFGLAALAPISAVRTTTRLLEGEPLLEALHLLKRLVLASRPQHFRVGELQGSPVVCLTDASEGEDGYAGIGVVVWDPSDDTLSYAGGEAPAWLLAFFASLHSKSNYIFELELVAALCAYLTFPDVLQGRILHHFIDNEGAKFGLIRGFSGKPGGERVLHAAASEIVGLACYPWFGRVASKDNLSDGPSRRGPHGGIDDGDLRRLGAVERPLILPSQAQLSRVSDSFDAMHFA